MKYILSPTTLTLFTDRPHTINLDTLTDEDRQRLTDALRENDEATVLTLVSPAKRVIEHFAGTDITVENGQVTFQGRVIETYPAQRAMEFMREGLPAEPLLRFIERLEANPSFRAREGLYRFLEHGGMPLTEDGCFLAYRKVMRNDEGNLVDIYTKKIDNNVGQVVEVPRNQVDEDPDRTCSHGLHACSYSYLAFYRSYSPKHDVVTVVKIDPRDVVAVPRDYDNAKMRVCRYEVVQILEEEEGDVLRNEGAVTKRNSWVNHDPYDLGYDGYPNGVYADSPVEVLLEDGEVMSGRAHEFNWTDYALNPVELFRITGPRE